MSPLQANQADTAHLLCTYRACCRQTRCTSTRQLVNKPAAGEPMFTSDTYLLHTNPTPVWISYTSGHKLCTDSDALQKWLLVQLHRSLNNAQLHYLCEVILAELFLFCEWWISFHALQVCASALHDKWIRICPNPCDVAGIVGILWSILCSQVKISELILGVRLIQVVTQVWCTTEISVCPS